MKKENKNLKYLLTVLGIWWTIAFLLASFQAYFMSLSVIVLIVGFAISLLIAYSHFKLYKSILKNRIFAKRIYIVYAALNFIPLALQLVGLRIPSTDTIIAALIGLAMIYVLEK